MPMIDSSYRSNINVESPPAYSSSSRIRITKYGLINFVKVLKQEHSLKKVNHRRCISLPRQRSLNSIKSGNRSKRMIVNKSVVSSSFKAGSQKVQNNIIKANNIDASLIRNTQLFQKDDGLKEHEDRELSKVMTESSQNSHFYELQAKYKDSYLNDLVHLPRKRSDKQNGSSADVNKQKILLPKRKSIDIIDFNAKKGARSSILLSQIQNISSKTKINDSKQFLYDRIESRNMLNSKNDTSNLDYMQHLQRLGLVSDLKNQIERRKKKNRQVHQSYMQKFRSQQKTISIKAKEKIEDRSKGFYLGSVFKNFIEAKKVLNRCSQLSFKEQLKIRMRNEYQVKSVRLFRNRRLKSMANEKSLNDL